jgi:saccharopine dehydrogenase (NAD+, L-lysine-forming)
MARVLIIGAGSVATVMAAKVSQEPELFSSLTLASQNREDAARIEGQLPNSLKVSTATLDAIDARAVADLIRSSLSGIVFNAARPAQNLSVMEACLEAGAHYIDTSAPKPIPGQDELLTARGQLAFHERYESAGLTALLSIGLSPGLTNVFAVHAAERLDQVETLDILVCQRNPVSSPPEIAPPSIWWEDGRWQEEPAGTTQRSFVLPELGLQKLTRSYHEELATIVPRLTGLQRAHFWAGSCADLPRKNSTPSLPRIGCLVGGKREGQPHSFYLSNSGDHEGPLAESSSPAGRNLTGVPPVVAAELLLSPCTDWNKPGVWVPEDLPTAPIMTRLARRGFSWKIIDGEDLRFGAPKQP